MCCLHRESTPVPLSPRQSMCSVVGAPRRHQLRSRCAGRFRHSAAPHAPAALWGGEALADAAESQESSKHDCSQGVRQQAGHPWGWQHPGYPWRRCQARGSGAWRRCRQALSASSLCRDRAGSTAGMLHSPRTLILRRESRLSRGPLLHARPPKRPVQGQGAVRGPTLTLPGCQARQARRCGSAQGKGWSAPYHHPRWEPILTQSRAPAAPQRKGGRCGAAVGVGPPPCLSPWGHGGSDRPCPPRRACPRSRAS